MKSINWLARVASILLPMRTLFDLADAIAKRHAEDHNFIRFN